MNFLMLMLDSKKNYSQSIKSSPSIAEIGVLMREIYPNSIKIVRDGLMNKKEFYYADNSTTLYANDENAHIGLEFNPIELDIIVNRASLAAAIDLFQELVTQKAPAIYIIENKGQLTVTDKPTPEIEEYLNTTHKK